MILRYWKGPLCTVRTRPAMDAIVEELLQIFVFWKGFLHYVKSVSFYSIAHFTDLEAHKNEVTKKLVAVLLLWVTGEKVTVFLGDDKWREGLQDVHKRDTICCWHWWAGLTARRTAKVMSPWCVQGLCLGVLRRLSRCRSPPGMGAGGASRGSRQHTAAGLPRTPRPAARAAADLVRGSPRCTTIFFCLKHGSHAG